MGRNMACGRSRGRREHGGGLVVLPYRLSVRALQTYFTFRPISDCRSSQLEEEYDSRI